MKGRILISLFCFFITSFRLLAQPSISSFSPSTAVPATLITITGTGFSNTTSVTFGGYDALTFSIISATEIRAYVGPGGGTGNITVTNNLGSGSMNGFTFTHGCFNGGRPSAAEQGYYTCMCPCVFFGDTYSTEPTDQYRCELLDPGESLAPNVGSFTPATASAGNVVSILGSNFIDASSVSFGGISATSFSKTVVSYAAASSYATATAFIRIDAVVPANAVSGSVAVSNPCGTGSKTGFVFAAVLPIKLTNFNVTREQQSSILKWETVSESNSSYFTVEHSADGLQWKKIDSVRAAGFSSSVRSYSFIHRNTLIGLNFYRLKLVDSDGSFIYSPVRKLYHSIFANDIKLKENNIRNNQLMFYLEQSAYVTIYNASGQQIFSKSFERGNQTIETSNWQKGYYLLAMKDVVLKFAIQ
ncbi:MAG: T9SS type A sorting domain-containing protein [Chitinophagaceae bacterium]|nr:MAG: T9SS type A sorting domain-containing protein [Chitinophagaceae bacterium]